MLSLRPEREFIASASVRLGPALLGLVAGEVQVNLLVHIFDPAERDQVMPSA